VNVRERAWAGSIAAAAAALVLAVVAVSASAAGSYGPLTCLDGFVWRQATLRDHVCVTPQVDAQTARDNALAPTRRSATSSTFGPDLCVAGFVWREALPGDRVCVTPATWQQVHDDNLTAGLRRNALRVRIGTTGERAPRYWVHVDGINVGLARVGLFLPDSATPRKTWPARTRRWRAGPGGVLFYKTKLPQCGRKPDSVIRVQDPSSLRWSSPRPVATSCASL
jgi:hypothetical protein